MPDEIITPTESPEIVEHPKSDRSLFIIYGVASLLAFVIFLFFIMNSRFNEEKNKTDLPQSSQITPSPTPYPFREFTIPYLREKEYKSSIKNKIVAFENATYTAYLADYDSDGLKINGLLTEPKGNMPAGGWPAIVFIHGYIPPSQYETNGTPYSTYIDYLARNGFVVFKIDLRGHGDSEGQPGGAYFSADYVVDALNAYAALQNTDFINPEKIGLWGHSMAGNVSLRAFAAKPDIPAVVIWAGAVYSYTDRTKYGINDASYQPSQNTSERQKMRERLTATHGADYDPDNIFWREFVPTNYLKDMTGAIQLNHAVDDAVVDIGYSRDLTKLLDETTIPHELHEYQSGGHNISGASFETSMQNTVKFYRTYLQ
jgi:dipeptidyl aminopeptidase/acylaminoacyl peptidase